jgi:hypothetical protein
MVTDDAERDVTTVAATNELAMIPGMLLKAVGKI